MKTAFQLAASALALAGLLAGTASQATNLAELPLKASVLAKPNVIFGMDDSSSMDSEVMQYNNDGAFWWNFDDRSGWGVDANHPNPALKTITSTWFNSVGDATSTWRKMVYLFPNGTGTGNRVLNDSSNDHFAIMPTRQFAFTRWSGVYKDGSTYRSAPTSPAASPMHNPLYYNPLVTYQPWAPAQLSTGAVTPAAAASAAAKSHPILAGASTMDLSATTTVPATPAADTVFTALPGMRVPGGSKKNVCNSSNGSCAGWVNVAADENAANSKVTRVAMPYYPATYWVRETCTPDTGDPVVGSCAYVPGSTTDTLKRYEIKSGNTFPSGRTFAAEMQNFANWFQYYRKRKLMLAAAMGDTMENLTGMRLGVVPFNSLSGDVTMYDADATSAASNRLRVAGIFYEANGNGGTPTRETLKYIGEQYKRNATGAAAANNPVQYACQRNNAFIVTDGFANNSSVTPPGWDIGKDATSWGSGAPYEAGFTRNGILADLALRYYTNNPRSDLATGKLQATPRDANTNLHMNTFGLTLGARGTLFLSEDTAAPTTTSAWPDPNTNRSPTAVDDLWRATLSGRGKLYLASTPEETALRIRTGLDEMAWLVGGQGGVAVSAVNLSRSDGKAYIGFYNQRGWTGDLEQRTINPADGSIASTNLWQAATRLNSNAWTGRVIFTASGGVGVPFDNANVGATVNPDTTAFPDSNVVVNYLRGSRTGEGDTVRLRSSLMGPIVNSAPVLAPLAQQTVYVASGEGMLHAINTTNGDERWAFVPPEMLVEMGKSAQRGWAYRTLLDGSPVLGTMQSGTRMLVAGLGAAGRAYYALDVSAPTTATTEALAKTQYKWSFPVTTTDRNNMGYPAGKPVFTRVNLGGTVTDVVLLTSGYDNGQTIGDGKGRLWMLNAVTGSVLKTFVTADGTAGTGEAGLAHISAFHDADGTTRYAYAGDLLGNLWRFDLQSTDTGEIAPTKLAVLKDGSGNTQPVTSAPELTKVNGKRVVLIGTGRMLDIGDFGGTTQRSIYVIADDGTTHSNARTGLTAKTYARGSNPEVTGSSPNWDTGHGWYMDLPAGEEINTNPSVAYGMFVFVTNKNGASNCSQQSYLFYLDIKTGGVPSGSTDGSVSTLLSNSATSSEVNLLLDTTGRLRAVGTLSDGNPYTKGPPTNGKIDPAKNAWREIRR